MGRGANGCFSFSSVVIYAGILVNSTCISLVHLALADIVSSKKKKNLWHISRVLVVLSTIFIDLVPYSVYIFNELIARFSWIHLDDLVNLIYESLINPAYKGDVTSTYAHSSIPFSLLELHVQSTSVVYW